MRKEEKDKPFIWVNRKWCKQCGLCEELCPRQVFELDKNRYPHPTNLDRCVRCGLCVIQCPDYAIVDDEDTRRKLIEEYILEE
ncbi:4Fe-4S binding protein [Candidatus Poribacteria bacterium]|nr:4Fe-4S binding protein [Candidatus Poribacteria bacterium]